MKRLAAIAFGISLLAGFAAPLAARADEGSSFLASSSSWINQSGSTMTLVFGSGGSVTGSYINNAAGFACQGTPYPIAGWVLGNFISIAVAWNNAYANCNSVTGWTGYAVQDGGSVAIMTNWNLAYQGASGPAIMAGQDVFKPLTKTEVESPMK
jgi:hypothetical protein